MRRRTFLMGSAAAMAGCATTGTEPAAVPPASIQTAAVAARVPSANEKLHIAVIGPGDQGFGDARSAASLGHHIVALCDVDWAKAAPAFAAFPDAKRYTHYEDMLATETGIDAVIVATPDHSHVFASLAAIRHGKHVYCEKPLTHTVQEARVLAEAARKAGVATQMGNFGQAADGVRSLCELIWSGAIGPVREVHSWSDRPVWPQAIERPTETPPIPETLDWQAWLGPSPDRPYHPAYLPFKWRGWYDFGTGALGDMACHRLDSVFRSMKLGAPDRIESASTRVFKETYPAGSLVRWHFPARGDMPELKLSWYDGGLKPPRPEGMLDADSFPKNGTLYVGELGTIHHGEGRDFEPVILPAEHARKVVRPAETLPRSIGHWQEWIAACKGGAPAGMNFDVAGPLTEAVLLGNIAIRTGKPLAWDAANLKVTNFAEADALVRGSYREGWGV